MFKNSEEAKIAGRLGGLANKKKQTAKDPDYFSNLGRIGGLKLRDSMPENFYSDIGKIGKRKTAKEEQ